MERRRFRITGMVQGVGFRPFVARLASDLGLDGNVGNDPAGVWCEVQGASAVLDEFGQQLSAKAPPLAEVLSVEWTVVPTHVASGFRIEPSLVEGPVDSVMPADATICEACKAELLDPSDRRFRYPLLACVDCGPRYTVVTDLPYDRERTTLAGFELCDACRAEYDDPADRRFHAQAMCCPRCGPALTLVNARGERLSGDPVAGAAAVVMAGGIVAVKGVGGFQLVVRADDEAAVMRLRERKGREAKPFAVLCRDLAMVEALGHLDELERRTLDDVAAPIVLLARREGAPLADAVAPQSGLVGVMLPSSPLHVLLTLDTGVPLVCTSANPSDDPIVVDDELDELGGLADVVLTHDRPISHRADDSVGRVMDECFVVMRRARGLVPRPIRLRDGGATVLAVGAHLKNTVTLALGRDALMSVHLGDLGSLRTGQEFERAIADVLSLYGVKPDVVVCDQHPQYVSTAFAQRQTMAPVMAVQHHHAHVASCRAEHHVTEPVIGVAFDGLGWGPDGTAWGGEFLVVDEGGYERRGHVETLPLAGGVSAIRQPWRLAVAMLDRFAPDALETDLEVLRHHVGDVELVRAVARSSSTLETSGVGRWLEGMASLVLGRDANRFEGDVAMAFEQIACQASGHYEFEVGGASDGGPHRLIMSGVVREVTADLHRGVDPGVISMRVHRGLALGAVAMVERIRADLGVNTVALTGGVFQNRLLLEATARGARAAGFQLIRHAQVPCNDAGISLGQAAVARSVLQTAQ